MNERNAVGRRRSGTGYGYKGDTCRFEFEVSSWQAGQSGRGAGGTSRSGIRANFGSSPVSLSTLQLDAIRRDLEASLPGLRACRQLLVVIPGSLEEHPRIVHLLRDDEALGPLRRLHHAFGEALHDEQMSRELDLLDP